MNQQLSFEELVASVLARCKSIREKKGVDYANGADRYANFKKKAQQFGISKYQAWGVYATKQADAIENAIIRNPEAPVCLGEPLIERIADVINYQLLLYGMAVEDGLEPVPDDLAKEEL